MRPVGADAAHPRGRQQHDVRPPLAHPGLDGGPVTQVQLRPRRAQHLRAGRSQRPHEGGPDQAVVPGHEHAASCELVHGERLPACTRRS